MLNKVLKIATRKSPLALWQAEYVKKVLISYYPNLNIKLIPMNTIGDIKLYTDSKRYIKKNSFVKELQKAIIEYRADIAVHSMKDVPINFPPKLGIIAVCKRENPFDAFISNKYSSIQSLPYAANIGTSSLRRQCQLMHIRPDLNIIPIHGNIGTRLLKLDNNEYDAIILAVAGLKRLGLKNRIKNIFLPNEILPASGQGAIGIECLLENIQTINLISVLNDKDSADCIKAERTMNMHLNGGCSTPIGSYAVLKNKNQIWLRGFIGSTDGKKIIKAEYTGARKDSEFIGTNLAKDLLSQGALNILKNLS